MEIKIETSEDRVQVHTPYHPHFPQRARALGGRWDNSCRCWMFDRRDEGRIRELCREIYGTDGSDAAASDLVTVRVTVGQDDWSEHTGALYLYGRQVARARGRDSGAKLGEGVVLLSGGVCSDGSMKNWYTTARPGTVLEIRDVPRRAVEENGVPREVEVEIVGESTDYDALRAERERLTARIAEIDAILNP